MSVIRITENLASIGERLDDACSRCGREPDTVGLVAVTKYARVEWIEALLEAGITTLGESRPQQLVERAAELPDTITWHLVGHLQRNKVRRVLPLTALTHSIDSLRLLRRIETIAAEIGSRPHLLLEVNIAGESARDGFRPDELDEIVDIIPELDHVQVDGLMTMAPWSDNPQETRPIFSGLRKLRDRLVERSSGALSLPELSMGMSHDFEVAIEEGATLVRIGRRLFDGLDEPP